MTLLELDITGFAHGGTGVARHGDSGRVVFVAGALPGERVIARLDGRPDDGDRFWRATAIEIIEGVPQRIPVSCPAAAAGAGCCDLAHVEPGFARDLKRGVLEDLLRRIGRLDEAAVAGLLGRVAPFDDAVAGWRVRTRLAVDGDGRAGLRAAGSAEVITVPCSAPVPGLTDGLDALDLRPGTELVVAAGADGERQVAELIPAATGGARHRRSGRRAAQRRRGAREAARTGRTLEGDGIVTEQVGPWRWRLPVTAFWQAHRAAPAVYSQTLIDLLAGSRAAWAPDGPVTAWDLFGGAGVFAGALLAGAADLGITVGGIEIADSDAVALAAAEQTFADAPVTIRAGRIGAGSAGAGSAGPAGPEVVIVDPPRAGAKAPVIDLIAAAAPAAVVHVGCDPAAFARDLARYGEHGYRPVELRAFDAFPNTHHVEVIALLLRP